MLNKKNQAFTLIELLIVITIIGILSTITLKLNWWQIKDMEAMNDKEQRLSRHKNQNNIITNTNFIDKRKILTGIQFIYTHWSQSVIENIEWSSVQHSLKYHTLSGNLTITKQPLTLWCTVTEPNKIEFIWPNKNTCFTINTNLCSWELCQ